MCNIFCYNHDFRILNRNEAATLHKKFSAVLTVFVLACSCAWADTTINAGSFPDSTFREFVSNFDTNNDGILQDSEIAAVETINVRGMGISSLEGIGVFTALKNLRCSSNNLTALDLSGNTLLESLACDENRITALNLTACKNLREVFCTSCGLQDLDITGLTALRELYCYTNSLDVLDVSFNTALVSLDCQNNALTSLNTRHNSLLEFLDCSTNSLASLNLSMNPKLRTLYAHDLNLGANGLDVSALEDLRTLGCWNDGLTSLNLTNNKLLGSLACFNNSLTTLDVENLDSITELLCANNPLDYNGGTQLINTLRPLEAGTDNSVIINSISGYSALTSSDVTARDITGRIIRPSEFSRIDYAHVKAVFDERPAMMGINCDTGHESVKLAASLLAEENNPLAPCYNGIFSGIVSGDIAMWKGIPFAQQPVGTLRWKAPQAANANSRGEVFPARAYAPAPLQPESSTNPMAIMPRGEECLALNVWTNGRSFSAPKPVMVWVYGGSFNSGGTNNPSFDGLRFIQAHDDVVLVSVGYRVGIMGFIDFANSGIPGGTNYPDSGNLGLLDVECALEWVHNNIKAFGGDPENITVFGQSAGAGLVALLLTRADNQGLFKRAIIESGAVSMTGSVEECVPLALYLAQVTSADTMDKLLALSSQDLMAASEQLAAATNFPELDGRILSLDIYAAFEARSASFDILTGSTANEANYFIMGIGAETFAQYMPMIKQQLVQGIAAVNSDDAKIMDEFTAYYMSQHEGATEVEAFAEFLNDLFFRGPVLAEAGLHGGRKYVYYWAYGVPGVGAYHSMENSYIFNNNADPITSSTYNQGLADRVQAMWINFAKTGSPSTSPTWPEYTAGSQATMIIDDPLSVVNGNLTEQYALVYPLVMKYRPSGRAVISMVEAVSRQPVTPDPSGDITPTPTPIDSGDIVPVSPDIRSIGRSNGGCNAGFMFPVLLAGIILAVKRRG